MGREPFRQFLLQGLRRCRLRLAAPVLAFLLNFFDRPLGFVRQFFACGRELLLPLLACRTVFRSHGVRSGFARRSADLLLGIRDQPRHLPRQLQRSVGRARRRRHHLQRSVDSNRRRRHFRLTRRARMFCCLL